MPQSINVIGFDPSLRNWGIAKGSLCLDTSTLTLENVDLINPVLSKGKQTRQNSLDLEAAQQLFKAAKEAAAGAKAIFVEVPVGSQSARSMASYGICAGVLGALRASGIPFFELTPTEIKLAGAGTKTATKEDMILWAVNKHPEAPWPVYKQQGETKISEAKAEHMADATAAIYAGIKLPAFQQYLSLMRQHL